MKRVVVVAVALWAMASTARAQVVRGGNRVVYKPVTTIDIGGTKLTGDPIKPQVDIITVRHAARFDSLIRLRTDFEPELQGTAAKL